MREYKTLKKLRRGEVVDIGGMQFRMIDGSIKPGDLYIAERNTGPHLLTAKKISELGCIFPTTIDYPYDLWECVKVCEFLDRHTFTREDETLGQRTCTIEVDDPGLDGTGYEHPAYYRGQKDAADAIVNQLNRILDTGECKGACSNSSLQTLRVRLRKLVDKGEP